ncbi:MAG: acyltransferase [Chthoniobacterales bacterium]|nr:acyltransferase [Chthoniobacterales bacterium]
MSDSLPLADPRFATRERQPGLDLLRALAILLVVFYHAGIYGFALPHDWHRFGWVGVDLFFVLSGYLIAGQLLTPLARGKQLDLARFFWRRALRILPAYLVILAIYFFLPFLREFPEIPPLWKFLAFAQNIDLRGGTAFSHAWSLCVEGQFYLILPFLLLLIVQWKNGGVFVACAVFVAGLVLRAMFAHLHPAGTGVSFLAFQRLIYYPTWTRLDPLVFGVGLAAIEQFRQPWWLWLQDAARWLWAPGLAVIVYGLSLGENDLTIATCVWQFPLIALGMATLLVCAISPRLPFRRFALPGAAFVASIAYSIYLSHKLVIHAVTQLCASWNMPLTSAGAIGLNLLSISFVGALLFFAVERPFLQLRRRRVPARSPSGE